MLLRTRLLEVQTRGPRPPALLFRVFLLSALLSRLETISIQRKEAAQELLVQQVVQQKVEAAQVKSSSSADAAADAKGTATELSTAGSQQAPVEPQAGLSLPTEEEPRQDYASSVPLGDYPDVLTEVSAAAGDAEADSQEQTIDKPHHKRGAKKTGKHKHHKKSTPASIFASGGIRFDEDDFDEDGFGGQVQDAEDTFERTMKPVVTLRRQPDHRWPNKATQAEVPPVTSSHSQPSPEIHQSSRLRPNTATSREPTSQVAQEIQRNAHDLASPTPTKDDLSQATATAVKTGAEFHANAMHATRPRATSAIGTNVHHMAKDGRPAAKGGVAGAAAQADAVLSKKADSSSDKPEQLEHRLTHAAESHSRGEFARKDTVRTDSAHPPSGEPGRPPSRWKDAESLLPPMKAAPASVPSGQPDQLSSRNADKLPSSSQYEPIPPSIVKSSSVSIPVDSKSITGFESELLMHSQLMVWNADNANCFKAGDRVRPEAAAKTAALMANHSLKYLAAGCWIMKPEGNKTGDTCVSIDDTVPPKLALSGLLPCNISGSYFVKASVGSNATDSINATDGIALVHVDSSSVVRCSTHACVLDSDLTNIPKFTEVSTGGLWICDNDAGTDQQCVQPVVDIPGTAAVAFRNSPTRNTGVVWPKNILNTCINFTCSGDGVIYPGDDIARLLLCHGECDQTVCCTNPDQVERTNQDPEKQDQDKLRAGAWALGPSGSIFALKLFSVAVALHCQR